MYPAAIRTAVYSQLFPEMNMKRSSTRPHSFLEIYNMDTPLLTFGCYSGFSSYSLDVLFANIPQFISRNTFIKKEIIMDWR
jgi:hypothetical protein